MLLLWMNEQNTAPLYTKFTAGIVLSTAQYSGHVISYKYMSVSNLSVWRERNYVFRFCFAAKRVDVPSFYFA